MSLVLQTTAQCSRSPSFKSNYRVSCVSSKVLLSFDSINPLQNEAAYDDTLHFATLVLAYSKRRQEQKGSMSPEHSIAEADRKNKMVTTRVELATLAYQG